MPISDKKTIVSLYHYDPLDRQRGCTPSQQPAIQRFYCKSRLITEIQGAVCCSIIQHEDQLLALQQSHGGAPNSALLVVDQQRSVLNALFNNPPRPSAYTPYGHQLPTNGWLSLLGFNGERPDPVTGHYHLGNGYRQFNPVLMRFNSPDSWSPFGKGGVNAYGYCGGEPINRSDPNGHAFVKPLLKLMTKQLKTLPNHPTQKVSQLTKNILKSSKNELGGTKGVKKLAGQYGLKPEEVLLEHAFGKIDKSLKDQFSRSRSILESDPPPPNRSHNLDAIKLNISMFSDSLMDLSQGANQILKPPTLREIDTLHRLAKGRIQKIIEQRVLPAYPWLSASSRLPSYPPPYVIPSPDSLPPSYYDNVLIRKS